MAVEKLIINCKTQK